MLKAIRDFFDQSLGGGEAERGPGCSRSSPNAMPGPGRGPERAERQSYASPPGTDADPTAASRAASFAVM